MSLFFFPMNVGRTPGEKAFWTMQRGAIETDFKEEVYGFIQDCRREHGIPAFLTHHAGRRFLVYGEQAVYGKCVAADKHVRQVLLSNVPEDDVKLIDSGTGDWKWLEKKYDPEKIVEEDGTK